MFRERFYYVVRWFCFRVWPISVTMREFGEWNYDLGISHARAVVEGERWAEAQGDALKAFQDWWVGVVLKRVRNGF